MEMFQFFKRVFSFEGKSTRIQYLIFLIIELNANFGMTYFFNKITKETETLINVSYILLIYNILFLPVQAVTTRRLRDIGINRGYIFLNFIPIINVFFKLFLLFKKSKRLKITIS